MPAERLKPPVTALVVDDVRPLLGLVSDLLALDGVAALTADGPEAAAKALASATAPPLAALIDLNMPGGGAECLRLVRALDPSLPCWAMSGEAELADGPPPGFDGALPKPFFRAQLRAFLDAARELGGRRGRA